ncbi:MAG TPA: cation-translocating P-type ATPase [Lactovum miscens]|uniref:heavy metal translocating P-type ATPase n=1 Tax=Lactovum miscens TaxID=190387 RepID=UPI002EDBAEE3
MRKQNFIIIGMNNAKGANIILRALNSSDQVEKEIVNIATGKVKIRVKDSFSDGEIIKLVEDVGFDAIVYDKVRKMKDWKVQFKKNRNLKISFWLSLIFTTPVVMATIGDVFGWGLFRNFHIIWIQLALATPVQFIVGWRFYRGAYYALKNKSVNMDVLVAIGTTSAYFSSLIFAVFLGKMDALNFESCMGIITLIVMGRLLEQNSKEKISNVIATLMSSREKYVHTAKGDMKIETVQASDHIRIFAGEKVPLDVEIISGRASFDESCISGESLPVIKSEGDMLNEGALTLDGEIQAMVIHEIEDSTTAKTVSLMLEDKCSKSKVRKYAEKIYAIFVPVVLLIAILTLILTLVFSHDLLTSMMHAVAVLIISCPCALGLAMPTALISGKVLSSNHGILIKDTNALELAGQIKTVFFDKISTITTGEFEMNDFTGDEFEYKVLASLEAQSKHPLARAVELKEVFDVSDFKEIMGLGLTGVINGISYYAGNDKLMRQNNVNIEEKNSKAIYLAVAGKLIATATFKSSIKADSIRVIKYLKKHRVKTVLLTSGNEIEARRIQYEVQLDEVKAGLSSNEKLELVAQTPDAMLVGDGFNDSIALASASVGVAMATGSNLSMEAGDVTVISEKLWKIPELIRISHKTIQKVKQNYFLAFVYNIIAIPLAAFGLLNPMIVLVVMSLSSISVIVNSILLTQEKIKVID